MEEKEMFFKLLSREIYQSCLGALPFKAQPIEYTGQTISAQWAKDTDLCLWEDETSCIATGLFVNRDGSLREAKSNSQICDHGTLLPAAPSTFLALQGKLMSCRELIQPHSPELPHGYERLCVADDSPLRPAQREAVRKADAPISFIWGPPGTGKTFTIVKAVEAILAADRKNKVLVTATADKAVQAIVDGLLSLGLEKKLQQFRDDRNTPDVDHRAYDYHSKQALVGSEESKTQHLALAEHAIVMAKVLAANSLASCAKLIRGKFKGVTHLIIDEASMMPVYMIRILNHLLAKIAERNPRSRSLRVVIVGDPRQLPCVVVSKAMQTHDMGKNIYQYFGLGDVKLSNPQNIVTFLDLTSRMPDQLTRAVSNTFYGGALQPLRNPADFNGLFGVQGEKQVGYWNGGTTPWAQLIGQFNPTPPNPPKSLKNTSMDEACEVTKLAWLCQRKNRKCLILTPYNNQVYLINSWLKENNINCAEATTIHKAQGQEADIVIWSVVANITKRGASYFNRPNNPIAQPLANVALSRAKQQVFIIGADPSQPTVVGNFLANWEKAGQGVPSAPQPQAQGQQLTVHAEPQQVQPQAQAVQEPKLSPNEEYCRELTASAAEEFFAQGSSTSFEFVEQVEEPEPISAHVERCHYFDNWFNWDGLDNHILLELRKDGVCTQKTNGRWTEPRLTAWFSEDDVMYEYSRIRHESQGWPNWVEQLAQGVKQQYGDQYHKPNSVLVNVYRNGNDYVSMHRDDEPLFDNTQPIASISLGATRTFAIGTERTTVDHTVDLEDKSLLLMLPGFQDRYWHSVPRQPDVQHARVNLTFRYVKPQEKPEYNGPTTVVNLNNNEEYDVYIGRAGKGLDGYFGNPIVRGKECCVCRETHYDNESIVACYRKGFYNEIKRDKEFAERISQLKGKRLGCFCKPDHCHGDVIVEYLESPEGTGSEVSVEPTSVVPQSQPKMITFSKTKDPYGEFGNMASGYPIKVHDGPVWPSSEHLYQACKFQDEDIRQQILAQKNAYIMKTNIARPNQDKVRADWDQIKDSVMQWCVSLKLVQNSSVLQTLRDTGDASILEYSTKDHYWGASKVNNEWQGQNKLGRLLMYLRDNPDALNSIAVQKPHLAYCNVADPAPTDNTPEVISQSEVPAPTGTSGEPGPEFKEWLVSTGRIDKYLDGPGYRKDHMKRVYKLTLEKNSK